MQQALHAANIPFRLVGGLTLLDNKLVKDALAYCNLVSNLNDDASFRRICNKPARRIGVPPHAAYAMQAQQTDAFRPASGFHG